MSKHNHVTRDIKPFGKCSACDDYWNTAEVIPATGGGAAMTAAPTGPDPRTDAAVGR